MPNQDDPKYLLVSIARILDDLKIPYLITGGIAVLVWGRPRFTADIDVVIEVQKDHLPKLRGALRKLSSSGYIDLDAMKDALRHQGEFNYIDGNTGMKVDFCILTNSKFARSRIERRQIKKILNTDIFFTSPEDLILIKLKWHQESGSNRQMEDIQSILKITKNMDKVYLKKMAEELGLGKHWDEVIEEEE